MTRTPGKPRVLRVIARLNVGGPARHVVILDKGLEAAGFETLLAHGSLEPGEASLEAAAREAGIPVRRIPGLGRRVRLGSDLRAFASLLSLILEWRPDVLHTHTAKAGTLGRLAAGLYNLCRRRERRCAVVHTFHGHVLQGYFGTVGSAAARWIERALALITDCILVVSPSQELDIAERFHVAPRRKIRVVPLGLELEELFALDADAAPRPEVVFGYVGRFVAIKNLPLLVDAFARVHAHCPRARLLMVGDGETMADVREKVDKAGLSASVQFTGWTLDLPTVYRSLDVLVLSSLNEGTPVAAIEAMAAGLAVVATAVGGVPDVVRHGQTGLLVSSASADELASAMIRLADSPDERRRLGTAARVEARGRYGADRLVREVTNLYRTTLAAKRQGIP